MNDLNEQIRLHSAGATIRHNSTFEELPAYRNAHELSQDFIDTWVVPFYMSIGDTHESWKNQLIQANEKITKEIIVKLLGDLDWRSRQTGAFFAAINNFKDLTDIIGIHLLKSEVCYAGEVYAYTFASFNTDKSIDYLDRYLSYYLLQPDLWFDQGEAMEALTYLDKINNTNLVSKHLDNWIKFIANKPNWSKKITTEKIESQLALIREVQQKL